MVPGDSRTSVQHATCSGLTSGFGMRPGVSRKLWPLSPSDFTEHVAQVVNLMIAFAIMTSFERPLSGVTLQEDRVRRKGDCSLVWFPGTRVPQYSILRVPA